MKFNGKPISRTVLATAMAVSMFAAQPVYAMGSGSSTNLPTCKKGKIWDKAKKRCVVIKKSSQLDDENIYQAGRDLAFLNRYDEAIVVLSYASNKNDPRILNYLGYSHRKAGRVDVGLGYYREALRIDPDNTLVREYMGEAFLQKNDVKSAKGQLGEIERRCGLQCSEYTRLASMIVEHLAK